MKVISDRGGVRATAIIVQVLIIAGLVAWYLLYVPKMRRAEAERAASEREKKIEAAFAVMVVEDSSREVEVPAASGGGRAHAQRLRGTPTVDEVEQELGAPDSRTSDFGGGMHLIWTGTSHKLEASFNAGRMYCLRLEDLRSGHGTMVFESSLYWHPF